MLICHDNGIVASTVFGQDGQWAVASHEATTIGLDMDNMVHMFWGRPWCHSCCGCGVIAVVAVVMAVLSVDGWLLGSMARSQKRGQILRGYY